MARIKSRHDIHSDRSVQEIQVPEWGDDSTTIGVRALSPKEIDHWQEGFMVQPKNEKPHVTKERLRNANARLVVMGACDPEDGSPVFSDDDISYLSDENNKGLSKVAEAIQRLSGIGEFAESAVALAKNSETARGVDSPTD